MANVATDFTCSSSSRLSVCGRHGVVSKWIDIPSQGDRIASDGQTGLPPSGRNVNGLKSRAINPVEFRLESHRRRLQAHSS